MATTPNPVEDARSAWRRVVFWFEQWAEALEFDISEHHERRIARLELEVAELRSKPALLSERASSLLPTSKEIS